MEQVFALKAHYLPHAPDTTESYARALWLSKYHAQVVANGIREAFAPGD
ncbi:hypothetical protein VAZ01S_136_00020 [Vibrio azureus NBRC 104587]|uniref:Uncharacterized protein n=1 Tax=Vibrio azureus NBRC 104587 TaxID=1219077 RepID=U3AE20_9VIBR|nr:hypothetical protein [Vibrio azureus]GAD78166.1 hypothetical protein VAZ01S_136_00020 [Vibrio azureus NBRC 104587]